MAFIIIALLQYLIQPGQCTPNVKNMKKYEKYDKNNTMRDDMTDRKNRQLYLDDEAYRTKRQDLDVQVAAEFYAHWDPTNVIIFYIFLFMDFLVQHRK